LWICNIIERNEKVTTVKNVVEMKWLRNILHAIIQQKINGEKSRFSRRRKIERMTKEGEIMPR
jgi:hypothetical protein